MFADPESIIKQFDLNPTMRIADLGAGSGSYSIPMARILHGGKVYACEVQKDLLTRIKKDAESEHINNIEILWTNIEKSGGSKLGNNSVDGALVANVLFIVEDRKAFLSEVKRIVKPNGFLYFIDWSDSFGGMGPTAQMLIKKEEALKLFSEFGFTFIKDLDAGAHHYGCIFQKK
jgi:ubiquinone/menaquinone biosynthesis C-methylase UbiE